MTGTLPVIGTLLGLAVAAVASASKIETCASPPAILVEEAPERVAGAPFSFAPTWDASVTGRPGWQAIIQQAMNEWTALLTDNGCITNPLPVYIRVQPLGGNTLGLTQPLVSVGSGCIVRDTITFSPTANWFVDPTPANDSEYTTGPNPGGFDLLTVARHEFGHAVGWTLTSKNSPFLDGDNYAPVRLNSLTTTTLGQGWHVHPNWLPNDVMVPFMDDSVRRTLSPYPDVATVAHGFDGVMSPLVFVDPTFSGFEIGSPAAPFRSLPPVQSGAAPGWVIMLAGTTHHVPVDYSTSTGRTIDAVRGGATIVAP